MLTISGSSAFLLSFVANTLEMITDKVYMWKLALRLKEPIHLMLDFRMTNHSGLVQDEHKNLLCLGKSLVQDKPG